MKLSRSKYAIMDAICKITGVVMLAVSIENALKGFYFTALFLFGIGGMISIIPVFVQIETSS